MNEQIVRLVFIGSGDFSIPVYRQLHALCQSEPSFQLVGVVTQPDKPAGRGRVLTPSPLKKAVSEDPTAKDFPILTPVKLSTEAETVLAQFQPDLIVTVDYGQIVPFSLLSKPKFGCLNIHPSLLPSLRGATPIPSAILNGLSETGVTIQIMAEALDAGAVLEQKKIAIEPNDTAFSLETKLMKVAEGMVAATVKGFVDGSLQPVPQVEADATFCYERDFNAENSCIDWDQTALQCERRIRASFAKPLAWTTFRGKRVKIHSAIAASPLLGVSLKPGELYPSSGKLFVGTADGWLQVHTLQLEGKNPTQASDLINGLHIGEEEYFLNLLKNEDKKDAASQKAAPHQTSKLQKLANHPVYLISEFIALFIFSGFLALQPADPLRSLAFFVPVVLYGLAIQQTIQKGGTWNPKNVLADLKSYLIPTLIICVATLGLYPLAANIDSLSWLTSETWTISRNALSIYLIAFAPLKAFIFQKFALQRSRQMGLHIVNAVLFNALLFGLAHVLLGSSYLSLSALFAGLVLATVATSRPSLTALTISEIAWGLCLLVTFG